VLARLLQQVVKILDSFHLKFESKVSRKLVDGASRSTLRSNSNVSESQFPRDVLLHLLLLCMRALWRGEAADLEEIS